MILLQVHIVAASAWLGVVAGESVMEHYGRDAASLRLIAQMHRWIDILFEGPLVAIVLVTGGLLLARAWPAPPLLLIKVGAGLIAVIANSICIPLVHARAHSNDDARVRALTRGIKITGLAIPFGLAALAIGLYGVWPPKSPSPRPVGRRLPALRLRYGRCSRRSRNRSRSHAARKREPPLVTLCPASAGPCRAASPGLRWPRACRGSSCPWPAPTPAWPGPSRSNRAWWG